MPNQHQLYRIMLEKDDLIKRLNEIEDKERAIRKIIDSGSKSNLTSSKSVLYKRKKSRSISIDELNEAWGRIISAKGGK